MIELEYYANDNDFYMMCLYTLDSFEEPPSIHIEYEFATRIEDIEKIVITGSSSVVEEMPLVHDNISETIEFDLHFTSIQDARSTIKFDVQYSSKPTSRIVFKFPYISLVELLVDLSDIDSVDPPRRILDKWAEAQGLRDEMLYNQCLELQKDTEELLPEEETFRVVDYLSGLSEGFRRRWENDFPSILENRLISKEQNRITSINELRDLVEAYNQCKNLKSLSADDIVSKWVDNLQELNDEQRRLFRERFDLSHINYESEKETTIKTLIFLVEERDYSQAKRIIQKWEPDVGTTEQYVEDKQKAENSTDPDESARYWLKILPAATKKGREEFLYVLANYFYWTADKWDGPGEPYSSPRLYDAAANIFNLLGNSTYAQSARYQAHESRGFQELYVNSERAVQEFEAALRIANGEEEFDETLSEDTCAWLSLWITLAKAEPLAEEGNLEEATDHLSRNEDAFLRLSGVHEELQQEAVARIRGKKYELRGDGHARDGEISRAISVYDKGIGTLMEIDIKGPAKRLEIKRNILEGFIAENRLSFDVAAGKYQNISEILGEFFGSEGHSYQARCVLCRAKQSLLNRDYDRAYSIIENQENFERFQSEASILTKIIKLIRRYRAGESMSLHDIIVDIEDAEFSAEGLDFGFKGDYRALMLFTAAIHRMRDGRVPQDTLEMILQIALEDALLPQLEVLEAAEKETIIRLPEMARSGPYAALQATSIRRQQIPNIVNHFFESAEIEAAVDPPDYDDAVKDLLDGLELLLRLIIEYHGPREFGSEWIQKFSTAGGGLTLGSIDRFLDMDISDQLHRSEQVAILLNEDLGILDDAPLDHVSLYRLRNKISHPNILNTTREDYGRIKQQVDELIDVLVGDIPIISKVLQQRPTGGFRVRLLWRSVPEMALLTTERDLEVGGFYLLPVSGVHNQQLINIEADDIIEVEYEDTLSALAQMEGD